MGHTLDPFSSQWRLDFSCWNGLSCFPCAWVALTASHHFSWARPPQLAIACWRTLENVSTGFLISKSLNGLIYLVRKQRPTSLHPAFEVLPLLELKALNKRGGELFNEIFSKILDKNEDWWRSTEEAIRSAKKLNCFKLVPENQSVVYVNQPIVFISSF